MTTSTGTRATMGELASTRGWGPGWPTDRRADMAKVTDGNDVTVYVHKAVAVLFGLLMRETERLGYQLRGGSCWGYAGRYIRGSASVPSNHSWGLAIDENADENPMGTRHGAIRAHADVIALWKSYGFRWGGDYSGRPDDMHFEFMGTPADASRMTERALRELGHIPTHAPQEDDDVKTPPVLWYTADGAAQCAWFHDSQKFVVFADGDEIAAFKAEYPDVVTKAPARLSRAQEAFYRKASSA